MQKLAASEQKPKLQNKVTCAAAHFHFLVIRGQGRQQLSCSTTSPEETTHSWFVKNTGCGWFFFLLWYQLLCFIRMSGLWDSCCADTETQQSSSMALPSPPLQALSCLPTLHRQCLLLPTSRGSLPLHAYSRTAAKNQLPPNILSIADQQGGNHCSGKGPSDICTDCTALRGR